MRRGKLFKRKKKDKQVVGWMDERWCGAVAAIEQSKQQERARLEIRSFKKVTVSLGERKKLPTG